MICVVVLQIVQSLPRTWFVNAKVPPPSLSILHEFIVNRVVKQLEDKVRENRDSKNVRLLSRGLNLLTNLSDFELVRRIVENNKLDFTPDILNRSENNK
jgi:hypothetical protein